MPTCRSHRSFAARLRSTIDACIQFAPRENGLGCGHRAGVEPVGLSQRRPALSAVLVRFSYVCPPAAAASSIPTAPATSSQVTSPWRLCTRRRACSALSARIADADLLLGVEMSSGCRLSSTTRTVAALIPL